MKLAVNYSEALMQLLKQSPPLSIDLIKVPTNPFPGCFTQFENGQRFRKLLPHLAQPGILLLGHPQPEQRFNDSVVMRVLEQTEPPYLSTHLEAKTEFFPEYSDRQHHIDFKLEKALLHHFVSVIREIGDRLEIPMVIENFPYYQWWHHFRLGSTPEFIAEVCERADCGFLLDIAHARCSAWHLKQEIKDYLKALPLARLREIHLSGSTLRDNGEGMRDTHSTLTEIEYELLDWVLQQAQPDILTIEYGGMPDHLVNWQGEREVFPRNDLTDLGEMITKVNLRKKERKLIL